MALCRRGCAARRWFCARGHAGAATSRSTARVRLPVRSGTTCRRLRTGPLAAQGSATSWRKPGRPLDPSRDACRRARPGRRPTRNYVSTPSPARRLDSSLDELNRRLATQGSRPTSRCPLRPTSSSPASRDRRDMSRDRFDAATARLVPLVNPFSDARSRTLSATGSRHPSRCAVHLSLRPALTAGAFGINAIVVDGIDRRVASAFRPGGARVSRLRRARASIERRRARWRG